MKASLLTIFLLFFCMACGSTSEKAEDGGGMPDLSQKELQYYSNGKKLYATFCTNCHTDQGVGLGRLIPPLKSSDYLLEDLQRAAQIIKFGQRGPITVNEIEFNQPMPANPKLTNLEIAEIVTYIANAWGNKGGSLTIAEVETALKENSN